MGAYIFLSLKLRIYCPLNYATGLTCPACGSTRAIFALLRGDFAAYMAYNPFAVPLGIVLVLFPHLRVLGKFRKAALIYCITVAALAFIFNLLRIFYRA